MDKYPVFLLLLLGLYGCRVSTEIKIPEKARPADEFARLFIGDVITGRIDSGLAKIDPELLTDTVKDFIINVNRSISGARVKNYRVVGLNWTSGIVSSKKLTVYRFGYEYTFNGGNILFTTFVKEDNRKFSITAFNDQVLPAPLSELTRFTLRGKSVKQYLFFLLMILVPIFILISLIALFKSRLSARKKIIWTLVILLVSLPKFLISWNTGDIDFILLNISLLGAGAGRPTLYSGWILSFNIPIGAILFWIKRKGLIEAEQDSAYYATLAAEDVEGMGDPS